jgi:hypothetical protein
LSALGLDRGVCGRSRRSRRAEKNQYGYKSREHDARDCGVRRCPHSNLLLQFGYD